MDVGSVLFPKAAGEISRVAGFDESKCEDQRTTISYPQA